MSGNSSAFFRNLQVWQLLDVSWEAVLETRASSGYDKAWPSIFALSRPFTATPERDRPFVFSATTERGPPIPGQPHLVCSVAERCVKLTGAASGAELLTNYSSLIELSSRLIIFSEQL